MWKKIILGIFVSLLFAGGIYWFTYTKEIRTPVSECINAIPSNASLIFESKQVKNTWKKLAQTNIIWEELLGIKSFANLNRQIHAIDSLIELNQDITKLLDNQSLFISAHISGANTFDFLYVYSLPNLTYQATVEDFIKKNSGYSKPTQRDYDDVAIFTIHPQPKDSLSFAFLKGILMMSTKQNLVEDAIRQLKSGISLAKDKNFSKVINTAGKYVDANVYINYKTFSNILNDVISPTLQNETKAFADFADCSGWDVTIKPNALVLSGFTQANDSSINFLNLFRKQKPQEIELTKVIPAKTSLLLFFGISNIKSFHHDYKNYLSSKQRSQGYEQYVETVNKNYKVNIERSMLDWIDNEMALVITEPSSKEFTENSYAVLRSNNIDDAVHTLNSVVDSICKKDKSKTDTTHYRNHIISHLKLTGLLNELLGWQFNKITENYFTSIDNYIVFANSIEALKGFINPFENNKTLAGNKNYQSFSENIATESNLYIYSSIPRSGTFYSSFVTEELSKDIEKQTDLLHKFEGVGMQFSFNNKLFYSTIYLKYNPEVKRENETLWEAKLDTTVSSKSYFLINHNTKTKEVFVQDDANKIYLISNTGKIIWTKQLNEKICSEVIQIDVLKNNKLQMVFNTRSAIYMYDRNGNDMKGFPIKLKSPASNAISVFDYEKNRDYRIFIACENKKIICFKPNGDEVSGFKFDKTSNLVHLPLRYFEINNLSHLCAVDEKGIIYIVDRYGEERLKMKEQMAPDIRNFFIEPGKDYKNTYIVAADTLGNIIKVSLSNDKEKIKIQNFETNPFFDYRDINNDKIKEYVFLTGHELKVFAPDKSLIFKYEFKEKISSEPQSFLFPDGTEKIGVVSEEGDELFLFNDNGTLFNGFPLKGKTFFSIGDMNNDGTFNVVTGSSDKSIYVYQFE